MGLDLSNLELTNMDSLENGDFRDAVFRLILSRPHSLAILRRGGIDDDSKIRMFIDKVLREDIDFDRMKKYPQSWGALSEISMAIYDVFVCADDVLKPVSDASPDLEVTIFIMGLCSRYQREINGVLTAPEEPNTGVAATLSGVSANDTVRQPRIDPLFLGDAGIDPQSRVVSETFIGDVAGVRSDSSYDDMVTEQFTRADAPVLVPLKKADGQ